MSDITIEKVFDALKGVKDPELDRDLVELDMIRDVRVDGKRVYLRLVLTTPACPLKKVLEESVRRAIVSKIPSIESVEVALDSSVKISPKKPNLLPNVKNIIVVASGKGGVGKSTVALNLAVAMSSFGANVGLLDADIYGPSIPIMIGNTAKPDISSNKKIIPIAAFGLKVMSIGFFTDPDTAVIWRGPLIASAVSQLVGDTDWGELDYLFMDLPPGTGDVQLTIAQQMFPTGAVLVTTPQSVAVSEVVRTKTMFEKVNIPLLGIMENMSYFICPECKSEHRIFGAGGAKAFSERYNVPMLGEIPMSLGLRSSGDEGIPIVSGDDEKEIKDVFISAASKLAAIISIRNDSGKGRGE
ncbi:MAG: Mrp/NBP35 family ATP-binding protein [Myxococcota bacterium]